MAPAAGAVLAALAAAIALTLALGDTGGGSNQATKAAPERDASTKPRPIPKSSLPPSSQSFPHYRRLEKLAEGTMGALWLVQHRELDRIAALKEIKGTEVGAEDLARFKREAEVLSELRSAHTIHLYDYGVSESGQPYYVMEYLEGINLQSLVDKKGPLSVPRVVHILAQVCSSLEEAHDAGLVHRDIKPANIMLCHYGAEWDFVKLLDFGLVKSEPKSDRASITRPAVVLGTPAYVAPESLKGSKFVDARADIYGLGAVAYYLLTGRLLFDHDQPVAMAKAHLLEPAPHASERVSLPPALDRLIDDCLKKDPKDRPASARALRERLQEIRLAPWSQEQAKNLWSDYGGILEKYGSPARERA
jgi:serine/threonine-protein kinase